MLLTHLKLAFRRFLNNKGYSFVNLLGLTAGLSTCLFIFLFVQEENSFDRFHEDHDRIFRVTTSYSAEGNITQLANTYAPLSELLKTSFPGAKQITRYFPYNVLIKNPNNNASFQESAFYIADSSFFRIFSFPFLQGDPYTALHQPNGVVLTENAARRYFGDENPMGKILLAENQTNLVVTGILAPISSNSTLQFDMVAAYGIARPLFGYPFDDGQRGGWYHPPVYTFVKFPDQHARSVMAESFASDFSAKHLPEKLKASYQFQLQSLAKVHSVSLQNDLMPATNPVFLYILIGVAFLILAIASTNYINITMAILLRRFREIGVRQVLGADRQQVFWQISVESYLFLGISFILAICIVQIGLHPFNNLLDKQLSLWEAPTSLWATLFGTIVLVGMIISFVPNLAANKFGLSGMLKNQGLKPNNLKEFSFNRSFIIFQFAAAAALLITAVVIIQQLNYIQTKDLGVDADQVLVIPIRDEVVQNNFKAAKQSFSKVPSVSSVSAISNFPWEAGFYDFNSVISGQGKNITVNLPTLLVNRDFIEVMGIEMNSGRSFSHTSIHDSLATFILNEAAARQFNIEQPDGLSLKMTGVANRGPWEGEVIGIAADFNLQSLHHQINPLVMTIAPANYYIDNFVIRLETDNLQATISELKTQWTSIAKDRPFEYFFLDEAFDRLYQKESRLGTLFSYFTGLALLIACLGMFALAAVLCKQRTKEIGIRKVLGASIIGIVGLLSKDFLKPVLIALMIASPIAYFFMDKWLQDFAYHIDMDWWMFVLVGFITLLIAFVTVTIQSLKTAMSNPVESLKQE